MANAFPFKKKDFSNLEMLLAINSLSIQRTSGNFLIISAQSDLFSMPIDSNVWKHSWTVVTFGAILTFSERQYAMLPHPNPLFTAADASSWDKPMSSNAVQQSFQLILSSSERPSTSSIVEDALILQHLLLGFEFWGHRTSGPAFAPRILHPWDKRKIWINFIYYSIPYTLDDYFNVQDCTIAVFQVIHVTHVPSGLTLWEVTEQTPEELPGVIKLFIIRLNIFIFCLLFFTFIV